MPLSRNLKSAYKRLALKLPVMDKALYRYRKLRYDSISKKAKTDEHLMIFCTFLGKSYGDTPRALYEYMLKDERYRDYQFVWSFKDPEAYRYLEKNPRTRVILHNSPEYYQVTARAKYWFHNFRVGDHVWPREDQVYVECWHGTPLKRLGFDLAHFDNAVRSLDSLCWKYAVDTQKMKYLISPSPFATEKFTSAWNLKAYGKEDVIVEEGYPRNDILFTYDEAYKQKVLQELGLTGLGNKKILLYAPTWRDNQYKDGVGYTYELGVDFDHLQRELGEDFVILFRAHHMVASQFNFDKYAGFVYNASYYPDIADLYIVADMLATDYSSVFFDYANLRRPMVFYMYDLELYQDDIRGFYFGLEELPGPIVQKEDDFISAIKELSTSFVYDEKYRKFHEKFNPLDDAESSKRVLSVIVKD